MAAYSKQLEHLSNKLSARNPYFEGLCRTKFWVLADEVNMCLRRNYSPMSPENFIQMWSADLKLSSKICAKSFSKIFCEIEWILAKIRPRYSRYRFWPARLWSGQVNKNRLMSWRSRHAPTHIEQWISGKQRELQILLPLENPCTT